MKIKQAFTFFQEKLLNGPLQNQWMQDKRKYRLLLAVVSVLIIGWQGLFLLDRGGISTEHHRQDASGFSQKFAKHFVYHFYYNNYFPLASRNDSAFTAEDFSEAGALNQLENHGESLVMEWGHWSRLGENLRIYCYLPNAWIYGTAASPSIIPFNAFIFILSLLVTWFSFWYCRRPFLGLFIIMLVGSSPFCLFEVYRNENIFGLMVANALIQLSLHLPMLKGIFKWKYLILALTGGLLVGSFIHIRGEILPILVSGLLIYWLNKEFRWFHRIALTVVLLGGYMIANKAWVAHFDSKWEEAYAVVEKHGGNPYDGGKTAGHKFWHPVFCGLGDYDTKYGYMWSDTVAYSYGIPVLKEKYGMDLEWSGEYYLDEYYDDDQWYYRKFDEIEEYEEVVKEKVVGDIKSDPVWYAGIMLKRIAGVFGKTSPVQINVANIAVPIPWSGWFVLPILLLLWYCKAWDFMKLLLFTMPMAATSIIIYGGGNSTYNSIFHIITLAIILSWLLELVWNRFLKKKLVQANTTDD